MLKLTTIARWYRSFVAEIVPGVYELLSIHEEVAEAVGENIARGRSREALERT
jgi:hypothetical protein